MRSRLGLLPAVLITSALVPSCVPAPGEIAIRSTGSGDLDVFIVSCCLNYSSAEIHLLRPRGAIGSHGDSSIAAAVGMDRMSGRWVIPVWHSRLHVPHDLRHRERYSVLIDGPYEGAELSFRARQLRAEHVITEGGRRSLRGFLSAAVEGCGPPFPPLATLFRLPMGSLLVVAVGVALGFGLRPRRRSRGGEDAVMVPLRPDL